MESRNQGRQTLDELPRQAVFALDIGTRSIIGMVGIPNGEKMEIAAVEKLEHSERAMIDGQIENIEQVSRTAGIVKERLEKRLGCRLSRVAVAAAGRSLRTESVTYELVLDQVSRIGAETVSRLEAGAISEAEKAFFEREGEDGGRYYLVGYSVSRYYLDDYILSSLLDHSGRVLKADVIATFLPSEVVESLYAAMRAIGLEVASLTLEPIAAINAAIPANIRLLNLALVDIGAGTSDIAVCRDGCITGYTMAVQAGDELTEGIVKQYLVDFQTAEAMKASLDRDGPIAFTDILGFERQTTAAEICESVKDAFSALCEEIGAKILEANGNVPSAVFLAGGGSLFPGLREGIAERLGMDVTRVAVAGRNFGVNAGSEGYNLENPEYATPLGIVISAGLNMINDSFRILLNGQPAKLFRSGVFTVMNVLMMNGYSYQDMMGKSGQNLVVRLNGRRKVFYGEKAEPCVLELNGEEAQLSDLVRAGDRIRFVPVRHGTDAAAMLSQLFEPEKGRKVTVNGKTVKGDVPLKNGDEILAEGIPGELLPEEKEDPAGAGEKEKKAKKRGAKPKAQAEPGTGSKKRGRPAGKKRSTAVALAERRKAAEPVIAELIGKAAGSAGTEAASREPEQLRLPLDEAELVGKADVPGPETAAAEESVSLPEPAAEETVSLPEPAAEEAVSLPEPAAEETVSLPESAEEEHVSLPEPAAKAAAMPGSLPGAAGAEPGSGTPAAVRGEPSAGMPVRRSAAAGRGLMLYLNDKPLVLPPKQDGTPYYLMDMLEYSGLDLERLTAPVALEVNGESGAFQQELKSGDAVRIFEQKQR